MNEFLAAFLAITVCVAYYYWKTEPVHKAPCVNTFPKIIFQTWKSKTDIPANMAYWSSTWKKNHPEYSYILWDDADNRAFVKKHFAWFLPTYDSYDKEIKRADAIRYMFLYKYGGIYADMDFESLKPLDKLLDEYACYDILLGSIHSSWNTWYMRNSIPNAIMISKPANPFWLRLLEAMQERAGKAGGVEEETGPVVLKEVYEKVRREFRICVLYPEILYPISWIMQQGERNEALLARDMLALTEEMRAKYPASYAVTYWAHSW
jgi:mannosyltransferase OCH1-like enzyme